MCTRPASSAGCDIVICDQHREFCATCFSVDFSSEKSVPLIISSTVEQYCSQTAIFHHSPFSGIPVKWVIQLSCWCRLRFGKFGSGQSERDSEAEGDFGHGFHYARRI